MKMYVAPWNEPEHVAPSMQSSLIPICSLVPTCMTAFAILIKISWYGSKVAQEFYICCSNQSGTIMT